MSDLCVCMRDVISEFYSGIERSLAFCALMLFLCSGSSLHVVCILPFGMLCLSARRMMFVKMVFAVCMSGGGSSGDQGTRPCGHVTTNTNIVPLLVGTHRFRRDHSA